MPAFRLPALLVLMLLALSLLPAPARAQEDRNTVLEGRFMRHREVRVGEGENLAIVVQVAGRGEATVVVPRRNAELMERARSLREGDMVRVEAVREGEQWWVKSLRVDGRADQPREGDAPRDGDAPREGEREEPRDADRAREGDREREADRPREEGEREVEREGDREGEVDREREIERDEPREGDREAESRGGVIEGWHATQTQARLGDRALTGLMIRIDNGDWLLVLIPRENERLQSLARRLERDDQVRITFEVREGRRWVTALRVGAD